MNTVSQLLTYLSYLCTTYTRHEVLFLVSLILRHRRHKIPGVHLGILNMQL